MNPRLRRKRWRELRERRAQFGAVAITVFLGVTLFAASYDAFRNLETSYDRMFDVVAAADLTISGGDVDAISADAVAIDGVADVETRWVADVPVRVGGQHKMVMRAVGMPAGEQPDINRLMILRGRYLAADSTGVVLDQHMADHFDLGPGDAIEIGADWRTVPVVGVGATAEYLWPAPSRQEIIASFDDFGVGFVPNDVAGGLPGAHRDVLIRYRPGADPESALRSLALDHGASAVVPRSDIPSNAALSEDIRGFEEMALMFPLLFLGAAGFATSVLLGRFVRTQTSLIGVLRAMGFSGPQILRHYMGYGMVAIVGGGLPGIPSGLLLGRAITRAYTKAISLPLTITETRLSTAIIALVVAVAAATAATWVAARRAAAVPPAAAMRPLPPRVDNPHHRLGRHLPITAKLIVRSIVRNPGRSTVTAVGVVLAVSLVLIFWGMIDSTQVLIDRQFGQVIHADAQLITTNPETAERVRDVEGVAAVERVATIPVGLAAGEEVYPTELTVFEPDTTMHTFLRSGEEVPLPDDGVLVGSALRELLGVKAGSVVRASSADGTIDVDVKIAGFVDEPLGTPAYASRRYLEELGVPRLGESLLVRFTPDADRVGLRSVLSDLPTVAAYVDLKSLETMARTYMSLFYAFVGVMLVLGSVMAFAVTYNTMSANINERLNEVATLRANGMPMRRVASLISAENSLLVALGLVPGLVVGAAATDYFMRTFNSDLFTWEAHIRPSTFVGTALAILAVGMLSQVPALRAVGKVDIAEVVRTRVT